MKNLIKNREIKISGVRGSIRNQKVGVRGFPNGIFNPWVRWITGLALAKNSSAAAVAAVALHFFNLKFGNLESENWKLGILKVPDFFIRGV